MSEPVDLGVMILREVPPDAEIELAAALAPVVDEIWIVEDLEYAGGISQAASILQATSGVVLGHGIAPAPFRNPAALAMEWATLARMHPGRLRAGLGHGLQTWMKQIGEGVESPLALLRETCDAARALLRGETLSVDGSYVSIHDVTLKFPPEVVPGVSLGVTGPKSTRLSGEAADGTIIPEGFGPDAVGAAHEAINAGREAAGRTDPHRLTVFVGFYCGDLEQLGPPPPDAPQDGWDVVGPTIDAVLPQLQAMVNASIDSLVIVPFGSDPVAQLTLVRNEILPRLG